MTTICPACNGENTQAATRKICRACTIIGLDGRRQSMATVAMCFRSNHMSSEAFYEDLLNLSQTPEQALGIVNRERQAFGLPPMRGARYDT